MTSPKSSEFRLTFGQVLRRGLTLRCAYCGTGKLFGGLLKMNPACSSCGSRFERDPGYFLGSTYINYGVTAVITTISYVLLHFAAGWSNQIVMPIVLAFCLLFPVVFFRYARSLWLSLDCFFDREGAANVVANSPGNAGKKKPPTSPK